MGAPSRTGDIMEDGGKEDKEESKSEVRFRRRKNISTKEGK